jgi:hypothetical protein
MEGGEQVSRARPIEFNGQTLWFDTNQNGQKATAEQLELLAAAEDITIDDLLDEGLTQGQVLFRLREAIHGNVIPAEVLERRRQRKIDAQKQPECRMCAKVGNSTRHHFVPRWLMRELDNYLAYSARSRCTIPLCVECHRDLHSRNNTEDKSIWRYLNTDERLFAQKMLDELREQHPKVFDLIAGGDQTTYEGTLVGDYIAGRFHELSETSVAEGTYAVGMVGA